MDLDLAADLALFDPTAPALESPYRRTGDYAGIQDEAFTDADIAAFPVGFLARAQAKIAPRSNDEAAAFLRAAHDGPLIWRRMCLSLQRQARGLPAIYPSAASAAAATPEEDRIHDLDQLRRGHVAYSDDPTDDNPDGHIYYIIGRTKAGDLIVWTNDALRPGGVDVVELGFFEKHWGDPFTFGAKSLNGYDFPEFDQPPTPKPGRVQLGDNFEHAMADLRKAIRSHKRQAANGPAALRARQELLVRLLQRDLERMQRHAARFN